MGLLSCRRRYLGWVVAGSLLFAAASCGHPKDDVEPVLGVEDGPLVAKRELYKSLLPTVSDEDGAVETDKCDSIHWSALTAAATGPINIRAFLDKSGKLHRRPARYPECYPLFSKSENSRDAFLMVAAYAVQWEDLSLLEGIFAYGRGHAWIMGNGALSRTYFSLNMQALYAQAIQALGGPSHIERLSPLVWTKDGTGYEAHLAVVSILTYGKIHGGITEKGMEVLEFHWQREPRNALYAAAYYKYSGVEQARYDAVFALSSEEFWPADRLPTNADRKEPWLTQRDEGDSWKPCLQDDGSPCPLKLHGPGDYLFAEAVLSGKF